MPVRANERGEFPNSPPAGADLPASMRLLTVKQLGAALRIHHRSCWRLVAMAEAGHSNFPKPLRLGPKTIRWRLSDVEAYLKTLAGEKA